MALKKHSQKNSQKGIDVNSKSIEDILESSIRLNVPVIPTKFLETINLDWPELADRFRDLKKSIESKFQKSDQSKIVDDIKDKFRDEKLVLVLGAGVSMGFGLPGWDTLLQKLMVTTLEQQKSASGILSKLFAKIFNPSPLIAGRYLQKFYEQNDQSFEEAVRKILYEEIRLDTPSPLMEEIVKLCVAPGRSPNLNSIITYNFDDILEQRIKNISLDLPFQSIFGPGQGLETGELPIYHVHGFLPKEGEIDKSNQITFGENIYHKQYVDTYSWNNIVQINKFREYNCLFIGTSLTDPNTRRLLDISIQQRTLTKGSHFIFKLRYKREEVKKALELLLTQNQDLLGEKNKSALEFDITVETLIETIESFEENDLSSFGIKTIWVASYSEIPIILKQIRAR